MKESAAGLAMLVNVSARSVIVPAVELSAPVMRLSSPVMMVKVRVR